MLYIAKVLNPSVLNFNVNMDVVNADYYHQAHGNSKSHNLHPAINCLTEQGTFGGDVENPVIPNVRTGLRAGQEYVSYTSSAGNMCIVLHALDEDVYIALHGSRHGLGNPIYKCLDLLGATWGDLELEVQTYITRNPNSDPIEMGLEAEFSTDQIYHIGSPWVDSTNLEYELNSTFGDDDMVLLLTRINCESEASFELKKQVAWEGFHSMDCKTWNELSIDSIVYPSSDHFWEGNLVTQFRGMTVRCVAYEGGGRDDKFTRRITMRRKQGNGVTYVFTEYANRVAVEKHTSV